MKRLIIELRLRSPASGRRLRRSLLWICAAMVVGGSTPTASTELENGEDQTGVSTGPGPSFLVIVVDTLRRDAVSAYGTVAGTTPVIDHLASEGLLYERATTSSPWTLPSHATILTGRRIDQHGVGLPGRSVLDDRWATLAEVLGAAGYETAAFSENAIVSEVFGLLRGFRIRESTTVTSDGRELMIEAPSRVQDWVRKRKNGTPFFAFVNLMEAHAPYSIRDDNPWIPPETPKSAVRLRIARPELELCGGRPTTDEIEIQHGLYHGDVHAADEKIGSIRRAVMSANAGAPLVTIVVSDHGELFGETQLMGHEFSVHGSLIDVPLVVHGLQDVSPQRISTPVGLEDLMPSILTWAGVDSSHRAELLDLPGHLLPSSDPPENVTTLGAKGSDPKPNARRFFAAYSDAYLSIPEAWKGRLQQTDKNRVRQFCTEKNSVFGAIATLIQFPFKYVWYQNYPARLHDLRWDTSESSDVSRHHPALVKRLHQEIVPLIDGANLKSAPSTAGPSAEVIETLKALGYVQDEAE